jgi:hypothetical protein
MQIRIRLLTIMQIRISQYTVMRILFKQGCGVAQHGATSVAEDPGSGAFLTTWIRDPGWVKSKDPDPG